MNKKSIVNILKQSNFSSEFISYIESNVPKNYTKKFNNPLLNLSPEKRLIESLAQLISLEEYYTTRGIPLVH